MGQKNKNPINHLAGYTIIEVMIVLAISGVMFLIASTFINGKQEKASFAQGVNEMASTIQNVLEQVTDGQYSDIPVNCDYYAPGIGTDTVHQSGASIAHPNQGMNTNCVFLGKMFDFTLGSAMYGGPFTRGTYHIKTFVGGRIDSKGNPIVHFNAEFPDPYNNFNQNADPKSIDSLMQKHTIPQGLYVEDIWVKDTLTGNYNPTGFDTADLGPLGTAAIPYCGNSWVFGFFEPLSNGSTVTLNYNRNWDSAASGASLDPNYDIQYVTDLNSRPLLYARSIDLRLTDGTQYADIIIGDSNNNISVSVKMDGIVKPPAPPCTPET
ncbi:MAG TPA: prepilin-type N-terminal cleavage/methylation domain-containing protein [Candidatus Saccharimonadales bacterium]|nr:prepilin-type N-terminal cleavage/methylation domain-containing protein [Candidatus Saccharimonadales bacterium]